MKLISIDPGYDKVGYAIFKLNKKDFTFITSDLIKTNPQDDHAIRLRQVYDMLDQTIKLHKINAIVIEQLFHFKNKKTVIKVAQSLGIIELVAAHNHLKITRLTPLQIKQAVTGYGTADKQSVRKMIELELGEAISVKDDDESDAVACGLAYIYTQSQAISI